jgi:hypothetical protein
VSIPRRLASLLALALAALAVAAAPAFATGANTAGNFPTTTPATTTTVSPSGDYTGTETSAGMIIFDSGLVLTCQSSDFGATVTAGGAVTVEALTLSGCAEPTVNLTCTVTIDTLPANLRIDFETGKSNWQASGSEAITFTCGLGTWICEGSTDTTLTGTVGNSQVTNRLVIDATAPNVTMSSGPCGTEATWSQSWTINSPATYSITA